MPAANLERDILVAQQAQSEKTSNIIALIEWMNFKNF